MCRPGRFIGAYMDEMIRKLYMQMQMEKEYDDPIEQRVREELRNLLKCTKEPDKEEMLQSAVKKEVTGAETGEKCEAEIKKRFGTSEDGQTNERGSSETEKSARANEAISDETEKSAAVHPNDFSETEIDQLCAAAEVGEEAGFVRGFRYGFRLCMECMQEETIL